MLLGAALASDPIIVLNQPKIGDDTRALPVDRRSPLLVVGNAHDAIDLARINRIEQDDLGDTVTSKNLFPKFYAAFESGQHGEWPIPSRSSWRIRKRNEQRDKGKHES